jgi:PAS domain S-box-containing protein
MVTSGIFVRKGSPIQSLEDIRGKEVIVQQGDVIHDYLRQRTLTPHIVTVPDPANELRLLASGKHDCTLMPSRLQGEYLVKKLNLSNIRYIKSDLPQLSYCFALRKGNGELLHRLDEGLNILKLSGKYREINEKWFGVYEKRNLWETLRYYVLALALSLALFLTFFIWSWTLKKRVEQRTAELRRSEDELREAHDELEKRVEERTTELAETVNALRDSEARYRAIVNAFDGLIYICSQDYRIEFMNKNLVERTGYEAVGESCFKVLHDRDSVCPWCVNDRVFAGETVRWEMLSPKDNRWYYVVNVPVYRANGSLSKYSMIMNITDRKRTERVITARLRLLEIAASHSLDELLEATIDEAEALTGSIIGFYHFLGADQKTLSLQNWSTRTKAEFCRAEGKGLHYDVSTAGVWVDCIRERRPVIHNDYDSLPHRKVMPPDHAQVFRELVLPVFRGDSIVAIIGVGNKPQDYTTEDIETVSFLADFAWDITERKQAEEALRLTQFCVDKASIALYQLTEEGDIWNVNECACQSLGYSMEEFRSMTIFDIDPTCTGEVFNDLASKLFACGSITFERIHRRKDGTTFPVEITANSLEFRGRRFGINFVKDITERKRADEALKESESRVRRKLESILDPEGDIGELDLADIIDAPGIQALMDDLYRNTGLKMSIIDLKGRVLVDVGWQDICLKFHRAHPETLKNCHESDTDLTVGVPPGEFRTYRCKNNMWHLATPIIVGGRHMGNLFMGQFFFENEELDYDLFRSQARRYGFPEEEYIAALEAVPRRSEERVNKGKAFFLRLIDMLSKLSYGNIKLARSLAERDRLTETLRQANLVVENSPVVLFRWKGNDEWPVELVSGNIIQFGYTPEEFLSRSITYSSIIYRDDLERVTREVHNFCNEGADQFRLEYRIVTRGGDIRWVNEHSNVERDADGCVKNFEGIVIDVTERKLAEEAIRDSRAKYQAIVDNFEGLIYICSQDYRVEFMNRKLIERTGYDATGQFCYRMMHGRNSVCPWCVNDRVFAGETLQWEMFSPKDNHWYYVVNVPIPHADGTMSKQSMMLDITERKQAEEELRKANMVVENSPVVLFRCKAAQGWPVELVSKNVVQFGYAPEEFLSGELTYSSIVYPRDLGKLTAETEEYSATGKGKWLQEYRIVTKEGDIRWISDETVCERNEEGEITYYEGVIIDVTERRKAEEQLILQQMQLRDLNRTLEVRVQEEVAKNREKDIILIQQNRQAALGELFDHIAHQWKQPLNSIAVIIQALGSTCTYEQVTNEYIVETVDSVMDMVGHMAQTVDVFRNFYRPDKEKSVFLVKDFIDKALNFVTPVFRRHGIEVDVDADPELSAFGYPKEYAQVLLNLLGNAKDALTERRIINPRINIKAFADGEYAVVTIADNAGGVPDTNIEHIFDLYFTTKESSGGTGIGLYMSRNIIEKNMGGKLTACNIDSGAQFRIELGKS